MSEKYTPVSPEVMSVKMELLFPPQPLEMPAGTSAAALTGRALFSVPDIANASAYEMPEAYIAALEQSGSVAPVQLEFSAIATTAELPKDISDLVANIDADFSWRLATPAELMTFGLVYPALVDSSLLIALGETDATHYPLGLKRTGKRGLELQTDMGGIRREGKAILLVRSIGVSDGALPTIAENLTVDSFISIESHAEKVAAFEEELAKFSPEEITILATVVGITELLGDQGAQLRHLVGDTSFEKISNIIIQARLKNTAAASGMQFLPEQIKKLEEIIAATVPEADQGVAREIIARPDFLDSATMQLRERAKASHTILSGIIADLEANTDIPGADLQALTTRRMNFFKVIGAYNKLAVRH